MRCQFGAPHINLSAELIRRELTDLARKFMGPQGFAAHHETDSAPDRDGLPRHVQAASPNPGPETQARINEIHSLVISLPPEERAVFDLIHYLGFEQAAVAERLGISVATVKRRFRSARIHLAEALGGSLEE